MVDNNRSCKKYKLRDDIPWGKEISHPYIETKLQERIRATKAPPTVSVFFLRAVSGNMTKKVLTLVSEPGNLDDQPHGCPSA